MSNETEFFRKKVKLYIRIWKLALNNIDILNQITDPGSPRYPCGLYIQSTSAEVNNNLKL